MAGLAIAEIEAVEAWLLTLGPNPPLAAAHLAQAVALGPTVREQLGPSLDECAESLSATQGDK